MLNVRQMCNMDNAQKPIKILCIKVNFNKSIEIKEKL